MTKIKTSKKTATRIVISAEIAEQHFETMAELLIASAPTAKAVEFAEKTIGQVRAKGAQWMADHAVELNIISNPARNFCPVADNRLFHMANLQVALLGL